MKGFDVFWVERFTAINEIARKTKSKLFHQNGLEAQPPAAQECTMKSKGVAIQWSKHSVLASAPTVSGFCKIIFT